MAQVVSILGMHRSGTSLLARILNILGLFLGPEGLMLQPGPYNPKGFWELRQITEINDEILHRLGGDWSAPPPFPEGWETHQDLSDLRDQARKLITHHFSGQDLWGWKDPRTCLTLPFWRILAHPSHYIICIRNPADVIASLGARDGLGARKTGRLWTEYVRSSLLHTRTCPTLVVFFNDILEDWRREIRGITDFIGPQMLQLSRDLESTVDDFIDESLRHHQTPTHRLLEDPDIPFAAKSLYLSLRLANPPPGDCSTDSAQVLSNLRCFAAHCDSTSSAPSNECPEEEILQLFWDGGSGFSEEASVHKSVGTDGRLCRLTFELPPGAAGPLRLDPGSRMLYGEIESARLYSVRAGERCENEWCASWSAENGFEGIVAANDIIRIPSQSCFEFITLGSDPQFTVAVSPPSSSQPLLFEIAIRLFDDFRERLLTEVSRLVDELESANDVIGGMGASLAATRAELQEARLHPGRSQTSELERAAALEKELTAERQRYQAATELLEQRTNELSRMKNTLGWRLLSRYGKVKHRVLLPSLRAIGIVRPRSGHAAPVATRSLEPHPNDAGLQAKSQATPPTLPAELGELSRLEPYDSWLEVNQWNERRSTLLEEQLNSISPGPKLSIVMPVYDPPPEFLGRAIQSVSNQLYQNWELCIADDASRDERIGQLIEEWVVKDSRIRSTYRKQNGGISVAANAAAELASGEYIVFLDHDDELSPDALAEVALYVSANGDTDVLYSDEDKIDPKGHRYDPHFKPDWSPELLLSVMYVTHLFVIRRTLFEQVGGLRGEFDGSQDYDLALRTTEQARHVGHIPKVLYHWRSVATSIASSVTAKPASLLAGQNAVEEALARRGHSTAVSRPEWAVRVSCGYYTLRFPDHGPRVAIIIPTRNQLSVLRACLQSLARTTYTNYQVVIADNASDDPETVSYLDRCDHRVLRIPDAGKEFNFAALNNEAVRQVDADYVLFLNNDTEVISPEWLSQMVGYLGMDGVGAVGARLLYRDGRIQHAGVIRGYHDGKAGHAFKLTSPGEGAYQAYPLIARNYAAVTAACMLTRKDLFEELGGFDATRFPLSYNDVDYCYRLHSLGYRSVYCPTAELIHHEGHSRGNINRPLEEAAFLAKYGGFTDPYYNVNLSLENERFAIDARTSAAAINRPIRVLVCTHNLNVEGAPLDQLEMVSGLKQKGVIEPVLWSPQNGPLRGEFEKRGIPVEVFPHRLKGHALTREGYGEAIGSFADWLRQLDVEVVYANTLLTFYAIEAAALCGLPSIWNPRESEPWHVHFGHLGDYVAGRALKCFRYPYKVVFTSRWSMAQYRQFETHNNFINIHDGLDRTPFLAKLRQVPRAEARQFLGLRHDEVVLLTVGTTCERKGQMDIVGALSRLDEETANRVRWYVVGDRPGDYSDALHRAVSRLPDRLASRMRIVSETDEVARYYSAADIYVCLSRFESFPRAILEAMAAGLPILTTPVFGISEQVRPGLNALTFAPGNVADLAGRIESLVKEPHVRQRMAAMSPAVLNSITDYDSMLDGYGNLFQEAWLSAKPRGFEKSIARKYYPTWLSRILASRFGKVDRS
jgi:GT2 family glycosyltransferase/glycosyltransferase involved in cell wall biosynthesis